MRISHYTSYSVTLQWDPPEYNGGSPVTEYLIRKISWRKDGGTYLDAGKTSATSFTIGKLSKSYEYDFEIRAANKIGTSVRVVTCERVRLLQQAGKLSKLK